MLTSYLEIFPHADDPIMTITLGQKIGKVARGDYAFLEFYCTDPGCDCRRVTVMVASQGKLKAVIDFGFDPDDELAGPSLSALHKQSTAAPGLLELFVYRINNDSFWLNGMYERYRKVRGKVDGRKYRGRPFPKAGSVERTIQEPPDMAAIMQEFSRLMKNAGADLTDDKEDLLLPHQISVAELVDRLAGEDTRTTASLDEWDRIVRTNFLSAPTRAEELAELLPRLVPRNAREEERMMTALQLLRGVLDMLRHEMECQRPGSREQLEQLETALARNVYLPTGDLALSSQVTRTLLETRVEILPVLREASQGQLVRVGESSGSTGVPTIGPSLGTLLRKSGCRTPFEGVDNLLDLLVLLEPELQIALFGELLNSGDSFVRDTAALMLFHPFKEVREGVAELLASGAVRQISPETLRRLIISRNWFPLGMRKQLDEVIASARRGGIACARLATPPDCVVNVSTIDGAGAQSFFVVCGEKKRKTLANILWKQGHGIIDSFVTQPDKRELASIFDSMPNLSFLETAPEYLDLTVNHALAVGIAQERPPHLGLLQVAETLGSDRWKAELLDPATELAELRKELEGISPHLLTKTERSASLAACDNWLDGELFAETWFEDDVAVDEAIARVRKEKPRAGESRLGKAILEEVLEPRRGLWLERLTFTTLWLRDASRPPVPWHQMFHAAHVLAEGKPLKGHQLMTGIAEISLIIALEREKARGAEFS
jgi:hypothetical protein